MTPIQQPNMCFLNETNFQNDFPLAQPSGFGHIASIAIPTAIVTTIVNLALLHLCKPKGRKMAITPFATGMIKTISDPRFTITLAALSELKSDGTQMMVQFHPEAIALNTRFGADPDWLTKKFGEFFQAIFARGSK